MRKRMLVAVLLVCFVFSFTLQGIASETVKEPKITKVVKHKIITDKKELKRLAKKGITDTNIKIGAKGYLKNKTTGAKIELETLTTTQLAKTTYYSDGTIKDTFATFATASYDGGQGDSKWDKTGGIEVTNWLYWNNTANNTLEYALSTGEFSVSSGMQALNREVVTKCFGYRYEDLSMQDEVDPYYDMFSWNISPDYDPVMTNMSYDLQSLASCDVKNIGGTDTWLLFLPIRVSNMQI